MSFEMKVPTVGESISEVTIARWNKKDGDVVKLDELLCELESDKATFELTSQAAGVLRIAAQEGDVLAIGATICFVEEAAGATTTVANAAPAATAAPVAAATTGAVKDMIVPNVGESITEVTISNWTKKSGDFVNQDDLLCEIESDKATFELTAEASGILQIVAEAGTTLAIGSLICKITQTAGGAAASAPAVSAPVAQAAAPSGNGGAYAAGHASPAAAKILAEKDIAASAVAGTGKDGRITKEDAQAAQKAAPAAAPAKPAAAPSVTVSAGGSRNQNRTKLTPLRKTIARRLVAVKNETAMLTTFNEVDMKPIMDLRAKYKDAFKGKFDVNLGFMSFFTKACTIALQEFPSVNAYIDGDEIVYNDFCDVSIAVSAPKGLVVPVIRNAEQMSFDQIEKEVVRLALKARDNKLTIDEMTGGTFTITNGGIFGSMLSTPIINAPQSAILGMHNIVERPMAVNGQVVIKPIMYVALSYDHRIIDGRESVGFLVKVKQLLEDPTRILLGV
jgi:2-oxoglutarate dehydrogenase E2 component (dihydrolipoamide succinyltransferase)